MKRNKHVLDHMRQFCCTLCGRSPVDPAHIRSRGAGGPDAVFNLMSLCRSHHQLQHQIGWKQFIIKFPAIAAALKRKGWEIEPELYHEDLKKYLKENQT